MALIIRLNSEVLSAPDESGGDDTNQRQSAEVILFPGVRYERWADAQSTQTHPQPSHDNGAKQKPDRDWLDI